MTLAPLIVPAYQPERKLLTLIDELLGLGFSTIVVVDDGSEPAKASIFDELRKKAGVTVLSHAVNLGKGAALKTAFNYILVHFPKVAGAITLDADGQHLPADVLKMSVALDQNPHSLILGARTFAQGVPLRSRFGNVMTGYVFRLLVGKKLQDTQTGLRAVPAPLMRVLLTLPTSRYEFELDMLITASQRSKSEILEVPITTVYEDGNKGSHFNPLLDSLRIYFVFLRFIFLGLLTYATDVLVFTLVYQTSSRILVSVVFGRAAGACVSMTGSKFFVFKSEKKFSEIILKVGVLWVSLLGISYGLMMVFVTVGHFNVYVSRIAVDSILFLFNFLVQRDLIFRDRAWSFPKMIVSKRADEST